MYKYTVYMYTCSFSSFIHAYRATPTYLDLILLTFIPTQALRTLRSPRDKWSWESCTTADFPESIQAGGFDFLRKEREREGKERDRRCHYDERICMRKEVTCGCKDKVRYM